MMSKEVTEIMFLAFSILRYWDIEILCCRIELMQYKSPDDKCRDADRKRRYATQQVISRITTAGNIIIISYSL